MLLRVDRFSSCKLLVVGRELLKAEQPDGSVTYAASPEMVRRANEAGMYWQAHTEAVDSIVCTGGYPDAALHMPKPPEGTNEGTFLRNILVNSWHVPSEVIGVEGNSRNTFENFSECIRLGLLRPGEFTPERPLVLSTNTPHSWRLGLLAVSTLLIPEGGLYRLRPGNIEGPEYYAKELRLAKITHLAIQQAEIKQGHPDFALHVRGIFRKLWLGEEPGRQANEQEEKQAREHAFTVFHARYGNAWMPPDIPILV